MKKLNQTLFSILEVLKKTISEPYLNKVVHYSGKASTESGDIGKVDILECCLLHRKTIAGVCFTENMNDHLAS